MKSKIRRLIEARMDTKNKVEETAVAVVDQTSVTADNLANMPHMQSPGT